MNIPDLLVFLPIFNDCMDAGGRAMQEQLPRRKKGRIASYVTLFTTRKMGKKTSKSGIFIAGNSLSLIFQILREFQQKLVYPNLLLYVIKVHPINSRASLCWHEQGGKQT